MRVPLLVLLGLGTALLLTPGAFPADKVGDWAFRPIQKPAVPAPPTEHRAWVRNPVDAFVLDKLRANGLKPSPEADRRTLARRVTIDLTGLPPTPEELDAFSKDTTPDAYEKLVDRLLASPHYGERWARHWLDVAHYADSHGQDQDRFRPNAWPYRDYLIRSLNDDKPYAKFVREQIAGDVLFPDDPLAIAATGFLAAGPWDESGLRDINENSSDRLIARNLDRDDIVTTTMTTFAGLTVHCARCHDHKFDPITQADYYALQAVFAGIDKGERSYDADPALAKKRTSLAAELARVRSLKQDAGLLTPELRTEVAAFEKAWRETAGRWVVLIPDSAKSKHGATLKILPDQSILSGGTAPERDIYTTVATAERGGLTGLRLEVLTDDSLPLRGPGRQGNGNLHLSELRVTIHPKSQPDKAVPVKLKAASADFDQAGWGVARAIDGNAATAWGIYPEVSKPHAAVFEFDKPAGFEAGTVLMVELDQSHGGNHLIGRYRLAVTTATPLVEAGRAAPANIAATLAIPEAKRGDPQRAELARWVWESRLERDLASLPAPAKVYCGSNKFAIDGSFRPAAAPRPIHVLKRGDVTRPLALAVPGSVEAVSGVKPRFNLKDANDEGQRRVALAEWLVDPANPVAWRVIVNRVWHHHFGKGIVDTPNDFGKMGGAPSHQELLDWLAAEFRDTGGSLKKLHKLLVTSSIYRQAVSDDAAAAAKDGDNRLLWRMNRGKLDAETVRDAMLFASGRLDETMYGAPVKHFLTKPGVHVTPDADYEKYDVDAVDARRRSIYRFIFRTRPDPLLEALDCPDASASAPVRSASVSAPQALVLWNNKFTLRHAEHLAALATKADPELVQQIRFASRRVLGRIPTGANSCSSIRSPGRERSVMVLRSTSRTRERRTAPRSIDVCEIGSVRR